MIWMKTLKQFEGVDVFMSDWVDRDQVIIGADPAIPGGRPSVFVHQFMLTMLMRTPDLALNINLGILVERAHAKLDKLAARLGSPQEGEEID